MLTIQYLINHTLPTINLNEEIPDFHTHTYTHIPYNNIFYTDCFLPNDIPIIMWHPTYRHLP